MFSDHSSHMNIPDMILPLKIGITYQYDPCRFLRCYYYF